jgi:hypothetical protein
MWQHDWHTSPQEDRPELRNLSSQLAVQTRGSISAHRLLQTRTLDGTLRDLFTTWYPAMLANDVQATPLAAAA